MLSSVLLLFGLLAAVAGQSTTTVPDNLLTCLNDTPEYDECVKGCSLSNATKDCDTLKCHAFCGVRTLPTQCFTVLSGVCKVGKGFFNFGKKTVDECDVDCDRAASSATVSALLLALCAFYAAL
jgi:hypothetical protein